MKPLKFVMTTTYYPPYHLGGDAVHVYNLSNELAKLGHEVHVIHSIDSYYLKRKSKASDEYQNHKNVIVHSIKSPIGKISPLISYVFGSPYPMTKKIKEIVDEIKPDVLHHHNVAGFGPFILGIKAPKVLYTAHDYWLVCPMNGLTRYDKNYCTFKSNCFICTIRSDRPPQLWRYSESFWNNIQNIDAIITPSNFMQDKLRQFGLNGNFFTIPNFVPIPLKSTLPLKTFPYFLFVGVLEKHKGILNLIDAFLDLIDKINVKLLIVGTGSLEKKINTFISKHRCEEHIIMLGRIDDAALANIYANALAVVIPSAWPENCPLVALEALSNGTPIIVSGEGGLPEIVIKSGAGIIIKDNLSSTLIEFLNENYNTRLKSNALNASRQVYSVENFVRSYYSLISKGRV